MDFKIKQYQKAVFRKSKKNKKIYIYTMSTIPTVVKSLDSSCRSEYTIDVCAPILHSTLISTVLLCIKIMIKMHIFNYGKI